jgi:hypothetical protein
MCSNSLFLLILYSNHFSDFFTIFGVSLGKVFKMRKMKNFKRSWETLFKCYYKVFKFPFIQIRNFYFWQRKISVLLSEFKQLLAVFDTLTVDLD